MERILLNLFALAILSALGALIGRNRKIGYQWSFALCFFLSPIIALIIILFSKKNNSVDFVEAKKGTGQIRQQSTIKKTGIVLLAFGAFSILGAIVKTANGSRQTDTSLTPTGMEGLEQSTLYNREPIKAPDSIAASSGMEELLKLTSGNTNKPLDVPDLIAASPENNRDNNGILSSVFINPETRTLPDRYVNIFSENNLDAFSVSPDAYERTADETQEGWDQVFCTMTGFGLQAASGLLTAVASVDPIQNIKFITQAQDKNYQDSLMKFPEQIREYVSEEFPIFQGSVSMGTSEYWANFIQSFGFTAGLGLAGVQPSFAGLTFVVLGVFLISRTDKKKEEEDKKKQWEQGSSDKE